jgi:fucose permease
MKVKPAASVLLIAYLAFISLGLPDALLGVAWPSLRTGFGLPQSGLGAVLIGATIGYFLSSFFTGRLLRLMSVGVLLIVSCSLVVVSLVGYAMAPAWVIFVFFSIPAGLGGGAIDAGLNTYGAAHFSLRHMNWLHAFYGVGAMIGPALLTLVLIKGLSWRLGYVLVGTILLGMTIAFIKTRSLWGSAGTHVTEKHYEPIPTIKALRHPIVGLQIAIFFVYTGLEVAAGQWSFTYLTERHNVDTALAGFLTGFYWGFLAAGRFLLGLIADRIGADRLLRLSTTGIVVGSLMYAFLPAGFAIVGLLLIGLLLAPIYPTLMSRTPDRLLPAYVSHSIGFQVSAAMLGAAAIPSLAGVVASAAGIAATGVVVLVAAAVLFTLHELLVRLTIKVPR